MSYITPVLNNKLRRAIIDEACEVLESVYFDTIVCCGTSGLLIAPAVAERLDKNLCVVRKNINSEYYHSSEVLEKPFSAEIKECVIIDDLVDSGSTIGYMRAELTHVVRDAKIVGIYWYRQDDDIRDSDIDRIIDELFIHAPNLWFGSAAKIINGHVIQTTTRRTIDARYTDSRRFVTACDPVNTNN